MFVEMVLVSLRPLLFLSRGQKAVPLQEAGRSYRKNVAPERPNVAGRMLEDTY